MLPDKLPSDSAVKSDSKRERRYASFLAAEAIDIEREFAHYRGIGSAISATVITFSTALLAWLTARAPNEPSALHLSAIAVCISAVVVSLLVQVLLHSGFKHQAHARLIYRGAFRVGEEATDYDSRISDAEDARDRSNVRFRQYGRTVNLALGLAAVGLALCAAFWWPY